MRLLMIFVDGAHADDVRQLLEEVDEAGYSRFPNLTGKGTTGRKLGSRAFPGSSELFVTVLDENRCTTLVPRLEKLRAERGDEEGLKVYCMEAEEML
jgi:hypothetical protein